MTDPRQILRLQMRERRLQLNAKQKHQHARGVARQITLSRAFRQARHIACYLAVNGEMDPCNIIKTAWRQRKFVYLPVLSPYAHELFFARYTPQTRLIKNRYGIAEPVLPLHRCKRAHQLQLIFMPLVAFDHMGNRLGMGGGFYDRTLHFRGHQQRWRKPRLIGLAHEFQKVDQIPYESWDVPLDAIATETRIYRPVETSTNNR